MSKENTSRACAVGSASRHVKRSGGFVTFEGIECSGKSTQICLLADRLCQRGLNVLRLQDPGGTPIGEEIRATLERNRSGAHLVPEAELLLVAASRVQLLREIICPALAAGQIVLCERFYDSTTAYLGYGFGIDLSLIGALKDVTVGGMQPDLTLLLDIPLEVGRQRCHSPRLPLGHLARHGEQSSQLAFSARVISGYRAIASAEPVRVRTVEASGAVETVDARVWAIMEEFLLTRHEGLENRSGAAL